ncbi:UpxY family transcription antiterminator [Aquimarina algiphila]|uniref:UpxY family transcription antiterminator n=1 Tax=Aquimarina algiphila TaxID=2047982 RepID=UPI00232B05D7|nr:UpxY family transcription antiterminator [Aquimarina algiphila]
MAKWYVLYVKWNHEKKIEGILKENSLVSFLPMVETIKTWSDRKKKVKVPLFPSYIFVQISNRKELERVLSIKGAYCFIKFGGEFATIREEVIKKIRFIVDSKDITDIKNNLQVPKIGEIKRIKIGPLKGLDCKILNINNRSKLIVEIDSIKTSIIATIPTWYFSIVN